MPGPSVSRSFACHSKIQALKGSLTKVGPESGDVLRASNTRLSIPTLAEQTFLLGDLIGDTALDDLTAKASVCAAPLFSKMAFDADTLTSPIQYGLLGHYRAPTSELGVATDRRLFHNTNIPFSTFICGLQGSGKSHTLSCLIENCLIPDPKLGLLKTPLSVLVLHF
ncbi:MAG: hypothetical protein M1817_004730, partial [Caeruleum heppii]